jgi:tRNA(adenine34) deaminase
MPGNTETFDDLVKQQILRLSTKTLRTIEDETIAKRNAWWDAQAIHAAPAKPYTPRAAYEALFFAYMGLDPDDVPVVHEDRGEIVWASRNPCPTLDACRALGLDTRTVCRGAYEKSTQAFVSRMDPELRFLRSYADIRPYSDRCLERIVRVPFEPTMRLTVEQAQASLKEGNSGYGAVVVLGHQVLACAHDTAKAVKDPSQHAEMTALRAAASRLNDDNLSGAILFSTCEPCPMCAAMAVWSNVSAIVFGASITETAARGHSRITIAARQVLNHAPCRIELFAGVLRDTCLALYG